MQVRQSAALVVATRDDATSEQERVDKLREAAAALDKRHLDARTRLIELFGQADLPAPEMDPAAGSLVEHAATLRTRADHGSTRPKLRPHRLPPSSPVSLSSSSSYEESSSCLPAPRSRPCSQTPAPLLRWRGNEAATAEKQLARSKELKKEEQEVKARRGLFKVLTTDLTAQQFIAFLLEERTRLLLELGSERLHTMTGNRYRLELDEKNDLEVVDKLDADKRRSVDTLSGGETFLASLALAIALAEVVTRAGGRLQCFFLDEGFGSLDPESFDLAMDGIERSGGAPSVSSLTCPPCGTGSRIRSFWRRAKTACRG